MKLRALHPKDAIACHKIMHTAVHVGAKRHYSLEQREAWAPSLQNAATYQDPAPYSEHWPNHLTQGFAIGATRWGRLVGFFTMGEDAHIDLAYVLPTEMGKGTAGRLYEACETQAIKWGAHTISTEASHLARRFFEKKGWHVTAQQSVIRNSVAIENFRMEKCL